jgi:hypothetical protein
MIEQALHMPTAAPLDSTLVELADEVSDRLRAGEEVDIRDFVMRYPQRAGAILRLIPTMRGLVAMARQSTANNGGNSNWATQFMRRITNLERKEVVRWNDLILDAEAHDRRREGGHS